MDGSQVLARTLLKFSSAAFFAFGRYFGSGEFPVKVVSSLETLESRIALG